MENTAAYLEVLCRELAQASLNTLPALVGSTTAAEELHQAPEEKDDIAQVAKVIYEFAEERVAGTDERTGEAHSAIAVRALAEHLRLADGLDIADFHGDKYSLTTRFPNGVKAAVPRCQVLQEEKDKHRSQDKESRRPG